jgi:hypothetical protein
VDLQPLGSSVHELVELVAGLEQPPAIDLRPLRDAVEGLRHLITGLPTPPPPVDLEPLADAIDHLREQVRAIRLPAPVDLTPLQEQLDAVRDEVRAAPAPVDLTPLQTAISDLRQQVTAIPTSPPVDLAPVRDAIDGLREHVQGIPAPIPVDLGPLEQRLDALQRAVAEGLGSLPPPDDTAVRGDLSRLNEQIDALRTALADRFDAIPAADLTPVQRALEGLREQIGTIPAPDLTGVEAQLARVDERLAGLPVVDDLARAVASPLEAMRQPDRTEEVLGAITAAAAALGEQLAALPDVGTVIGEAAAPVSAALEQLVTAGDSVRKDLALVTDGLAGLTQLAETGDGRIAGLTEAQHAAAADQRAALTNGLNELGRQVAGQVQQVESRLAELTARTSALDDVREGLTRTREQLAALHARLDEADEARGSTADGHALALARVTAAADGLTTGLGTLRSAITARIDASQDAIVGAIEERLATRLDQSTARLQDVLTGHVQSSLSDLGITQLRRSVAEVTAQVVESRADARALHESLAALDGKLDHAATKAVAPIAAAVDAVRGQVAESPAPDLGPVAAQLARLSAMIVSQGRDEPVSGADLATLRASVEEALGTLGEQVSRQSDATTDVAARIARLSDDRQAEDQLRHELGQASVSLHGAIEQLAEEVAAVRDAIERRPVSRWRRGGGGGGDEPDAGARTAPAAPSEVEQRLEGFVQDVEQRLGSLHQLAERAIGLADEAAQAASATLRAVSDPSTPTASTTKAPAARAAATGKKATAKKAPAAKKPSAAKKATTTRKASAKKATPAKRAGR